MIGCEKMKNAFCVSTPYHLLVSCSLKQNGDLLIIEDNDFFHNTKINKIIRDYFDRNVVYINNYQLWFKNPINVIKEKSIIRRLIEKKINKLYCFNDADPIVQYMFYVRRKQSENIILEEGIGLYSNMNHHHPYLKKIYGKIFFGLWYKILCRIGEYKYTSIIFPKKTLGLSTLQKQKKLKKCNYRKIEKIIENENISVFKEIWLITQPLVEDGICTESDYMFFLKKLIDILNNSGKKITIKIHPREDKKKYNQFKDIVEIYDDKNIPAELLISKKNKTFLLTISSSSVLNIVPDKNLKIIFLYKLLNTRIQYKIDTNRKDVIIVENLSELQKIYEEVIL